MSNVEFTFDHFWKIDIFVCTAIFKIASEGCSKSKLCDHKVEVETVFNQLSRVGNTNILFITFPRVCVRGASRHNLRIWRLRGQEVCWVSRVMIRGKMLYNSSFSTFINFLRTTNVVNLPKISPNIFSLYCYIQVQNTK